jgi:hypothetical protein
MGFDSDILLSSVLAAVADWVEALMETSLTGVLSAVPDTKGLALLFPVFAFGFGIFLV